MIKIICDICKKEVKQQGETYHFKLSKRALSKPSIQYHEVCKECVRKIKLSLEKLKYEKQRI